MATAAGARLCERTIQHIYSGHVAIAAAYADRFLACNLQSACYDVFDVKYLLVAISSSLPYKSYECIVLLGYDMNTDVYHK